MFLFLLTYCVKMVLNCPVELILHVYLQPTICQIPGWGALSTLSLVLNFTHLRVRRSSWWERLVRGCLVLWDCSLATEGWWRLKRSWLWMEFSASSFGEGALASVRLVEFDLYPPFNF